MTVVTNRGNRAPLLNAVVAAVFQHVWCVAQRSLPRDHEAVARPAHVCRDEDGEWFDTRLPLILESPQRSRVVQVAQTEPRIDRDIRLGLTERHPETGLVRRRMCGRDTEWVEVRSLYPEPHELAPEEWRVDLTGLRQSQLPGKMQLRNAETANLVNRFLSDWRQLNPGCEMSQDSSLVENAMMVLFLHWLDGVRETVTMPASAADWVTLREYRTSTYAEDRDSLVEVSWEYLLHGRLNRREADIEVESPAHAISEHARQEHDRERNSRESTRGARTRAVGE